MPIWRAVACRATAATSGQTSTMPPAPRMEARLCRWSSCLLQAFGYSRQRDRYQGARQYWTKGRPDPDQDHQYNDRRVPQQLLAQFGGSAHFNGRHHLRQACFFKKLVLWVVQYHTPPIHNARVARWPPNFLVWRHCFRLRAKCRPNEKEVTNSDYD